ncbi:hypothetical protein HanIR_Chr01g0038461 [Helianthus annuus]|nr:hypothetical protein HanIR_Chr01g0038461 [Helianthus annuus]
MWVSTLKKRVRFGSGSGRHGFPHGMGFGSQRVLRRQGFNIFSSPTPAAHSFPCITYTQLNLYFTILPQTVRFTMYCK